MLPRTIVSLLLISFICEGLAQKFLWTDIYNVDSLLVILPGQSGEERINTLNHLAVSLYFEEFNAAKKYTEEARNLAMELDYQKGVTDAYMNFGHMYLYKGDYVIAGNYVNEAIRICEKLDQKNILAKLYLNLATGHNYARNYEKGIEYGNIALNIYREPLEGSRIVGSMRDTINARMSLGTSYRALGKLNKALKIYTENLLAADDFNMGITERVLHLILIGRQYYYLGKTDSAKVYMEKALAFPDDNQNVEALKYQPLSYLGDLHLSAGNIDSALFFKQKAFDWYDEKGFLYWAMFVSNQLGLIYFNKSDINAAEKYYNQTERLFQESIINNAWYKHDSLKYVVTSGTNLYGPIIPKHMKEMMWIEGKRMYSKLYQISKLKNRTEQALKYHIAYFNASDTLNRLQRTRETMELQTKYETESKEEQIESLSQENAFQELKLKQSRLFLFGLSGLVILVVILAIVLIRQNKLRNLQQNLLLQQKLFRSQMNPHFIFNSLASIQHFIIKQDSKKASIYLSRFSELVRSILESSTREYIAFEKELSTIENYLELQRVRFPDKFDYSIQVDEKIDAEGVLIPPMLAQPFIENSIEHGIKHKKSKGNIFIRFTLKNNMIVFKVEDDGVGREKAKEILYKYNKEHKSLATAITRERIQVLNKKHKKKITFHILDLKNAENEPSGTLVKIEIPC